MKKINLYVLILSFSLLCIQGFCADDNSATVSTQPETIKLNTSASPKEVRNYNVNATIKGEIPVNGTETPVAIDTAFKLLIKHTYGNKDKEGYMPLEVSLVSGEASANGETIPLTATFYPKLTVLLKNNWSIDSVFGAEVANERVPGINYNNLILLFYPFDSLAPRKIGEKWESKVSLVGLGESYILTHTLKSVEEVDGVKAAVITSDICREKKKAETAPPAMKINTESAYSLVDGRLLKSSLTSEVTMAGQATLGAETVTKNYQTVTKLDISLAKDK